MVGQNGSECRIAVGVCGLDSSFCSRDFRNGMPAHCNGEGLGPVGAIHDVANRLVSNSKMWEKVSGPGVCGLGQRGKGWGADRLRPAPLRVRPQHLNQDRVIPNNELAQRVSPWMARHVEIVPCLPGLRRHIRHVLIRVLGPEALI
jgi:hypothetical protein